MQRYLIKDIFIVNEGKIITADVYVKSGRIEKIASNINPAEGGVKEINGQGLYLFPGLIDDQVHFREPGLTHKAEIYTEARAAVAGGVTSYMEMPNTKPPALNQKILEDKYDIAARNSLGNYSFFMGVSNDNADEALKINEKKDRVAGIKIFMGSSTGNLLVDNYLTLNKIFKESEVLIATHCEDEKVIKENMAKIKAEKGDNLTAADHPIIRDEEACFSSSFSAVQLAKQNNTRLHILHITTEKELMLFTNMLPLKDKRITSEACVHHLWFTADDYARLGNKIKCNPAIKAPHHKEALWKGLLDDRLDVIATDHAPHTLEEKEKPYLQAPAGIPLVQHSLLMMLEHYKNGRISLEKIAEKMCHAPAECFHVRERGYIREGYHADMVIVDLNQSTSVSKENLYFKCQWSPFEGHTFPAAIMETFVNGHLAYSRGTFDESQKGERLLFNR